MSLKLSPRQLNYIRSISSGNKSNSREVYNSECICICKICNQRHERVNCSYPRKDVAKVQRTHIALGNKRCDSKITKLKISTKGNRRGLPMASVDVLKVCQITENTFC